MLAVRNSKLPTLSAREIVVGLMRPRTLASDRRDGGRGIAMLLADVGVGICRLLILLRLAEAGADALISPISEKMSPKSAYLKRRFLFFFFFQKIHGKLVAIKHRRWWLVQLYNLNIYLDVFETDRVGLCNGAYGCDVAVGVDAFDAPGLWYCWNKLRPSKSLLGFSPICCDTDCDRFICELTDSVFESRRPYNKQIKWLMVIWLDAVDNSTNIMVLMIIYSILFVEFWILELMENGKKKCGNFLWRLQISIFRTVNEIDVRSWNNWDKCIVKWYVNCSWLVECFVNE